MEENRPAVHRVVLDHGVPGKPEKHIAYSTASNHVTLILEYQEAVDQQRKQITGCSRGSGAAEAMERLLRSGC